MNNSFYFIQLVMKVIVTHEGKQHVNAVLTGLSKFGVLVRFYTSFCANNAKLSKYLPGTLQSKLQKRYFKDMDSSKIIHHPLIFGITSILRKEYWNVKFAYRWYDNWVARNLVSEDYDILIGYENANLASFRAAKRSHKITVLDLAGVHHHFQNPVLTGIGTYKANKKHELDYITRRKESAFEFTDYVIALSTFAEQTVIGSGFPADRIYKAYLGIHQTVFKPKSHYRHQEQTGMDKNAPLELYFVGLMSLRKGLPFAVGIVEKLHRRGLNIRLTLIGPIDDFDPSEIEKPWLRYIPFLNHSELVELHHSLDLFIFPSNIDSWAQVVIEAMACGSPILVSENTGAKDAVVQGGGMVLPVGDEVAWMKAIEAFYDDRSLLETMGKKAATIGRRYTWEAYHDQIMKALTDIHQKEKNRETQSKSTYYPDDLVPSYYQL